MASGPGRPLRRQRRPPWVRARDIPSPGEGATRRTGAGTTAGTVEARERPSQSRFGHPPDYLNCAEGLTLNQTVPGSSPGLGTIASPRGENASMPATKPPKNFPTVQGYLDGWFPPGQEVGICLVEPVGLRRERVHRAPRSRTGRLSPATGAPRRTSREARACRLPERVLPPAPVVHTRTVNDGARRVGGSSPPAPSNISSPVMLTLARAPAS